MPMSFGSLTVLAILAAVLAIGNPGLDDFANYAQAKMANDPGVVGFFAGVAPGATRAYVLANTQRKNYGVFSTYRLNPENSDSPTFLGVLWRFYNLNQLLAKVPFQPTTEQSQ